MARFTPLEKQLQSQGLQHIAGVDEAGRGPLAGPVVCAAVILKKNARLPKLTDSKLLSHSAREKLFPLIINQAVSYSISVVSHKIIDDINILNAVRWGNYCCVKHLDPIPEMILLDGNDKQILEQEHLTIIKGDQKIKSIAAASVLAKVTRDRLMEHYHANFPEYDFPQHKGYGTRLHRTNILRHGACEIHRKSFALLKTES